MFTWPTVHFLIMLAVLRCGGTLSFGYSVSTLLPSLHIVVLLLLLVLFFVCKSYYNKSEHLHINGVQMHTRKFIVEV